MEHTHSGFQGIKYEQNDLCRIGLESKCICVTYTDEYISVQVNEFQDPVCKNVN